MKAFCLGLIALTFPLWVSGAPKYIFEAPGLCEALLASPEVQLNDLVNSGLVEPEGEYLLSPPDEDIAKHELKTAKLLADRLRQPIALLPRLGRAIFVPAVDGIIFDHDGRPLSNFSLKTFMPSEGRGTDLNEKLLGTMRVARKGIEKNYSVERWNQIIKERLPNRTPADICDQECQIYHRVFGLTSAALRPVSVIIDYTLDSTAILRLHMKVTENGKAETYITLNGYDRGLNILHLMERLREQTLIKEYIFLGAHHLLRVSGSGFTMSEY